MMRDIFEDVAALIGFLAIFVSLLFLWVATP